MTEIAVLSLMVSSLGVEAVILGSWLCSVQTQLQKETEEEETLTRYDSENEQQNLAKNLQPNGYSNPESHLVQATEWEYKIVRANQDIFRKPDIFQRLCQEELGMGWIFVEKLDDRRVRFKRDKSWQNQDNAKQSRIDPYRSYYGNTVNLTSWLAVFAFIGAVILPAYLGFSLVSMSIRNSQRTVPEMLQPPQQQPDRNY